MRTQSIKIPVELEMKNTGNAINALKSSLNGLSKDSGLYRSIGKEIDSVEKKFKELSASASRPFSNTNSIKNFETQFLRLGDRIIDIEQAFQSLSFKDLDLKAIPGAEEQFKKLNLAVVNTKKELASINTKQMKSALLDSTTGLEKVFENLNNFGGGSLINVDSFEKTFSALETKSAKLSEQLLTAQNNLEALKQSNKQADVKLGFFDQVQKQIQKFTSGTNLSKDAFANLLKPLANQAGMTPDRFLDFLGLNKQNLFTGTAEKIQKNLNDAISSQKTALANNQFKNLGKIENIDSQITGLKNYINAVNEAKSRLDELQNSEASQAQLADATKNYETAVANLNKFQASCVETNGALGNLSPAIAQIRGAMGTLPAATSAASAELERLNDTSNKLSQMKSRLAYFFSFYKVMGTIKSAVNEAVTTIKDLDSVMTQIAVVTQKTQEDLWKQMETYSAIANEYAVSIKGVYEISQLYYQQGLQTSQVMDLTVETLKMAKIANIDYATATDYMTVAVRGFKMEMSDAQRVTDVYSALAATTASDTEELAVAMSKTASSAEAVGSSFESTSAMIATMVSITREAPENIGSALKSIISRYGEMTSDPTALIDSEGEEMSLNKVDKALQSVGITLQDANGQFRDFDDVILELAQKWNTIDVNAQRYYIA